MSDSYFLRRNDREFREFNGDNETTSKGPKYTEKLLGTPGVP